MSTYTVRSVSLGVGDGINQIHLTLDEGQPNEIFYNITSKLMAETFPVEVKPGDKWFVPMHMLVARAGMNGENRG